MNANAIALDALKPCPFCGGAMMHRHALWPSDGDTDAVIHAESSTCGMVSFSIETADHGVSVAAAWNSRAAIAALEAQPTGWMPIESAPKDKVLLLGYFNAAGKWAACAHEFKSSTVANCLTRYTCTKCGKAHAPTATQGQDAAPAEQPQDDEPTWQELEDFRKRHWTHWNAADNLLIAHLAQKLKCAARAKE